jgi:hypothetical protein
VNISSVKPVVVLNFAGAEISWRFIPFIDSFFVIDITNDVGNL